MFACSHQDPSEGPEPVDVLENLVELVESKIEAGSSLPTQQGEEAPKASFRRMTLYSRSLETPLSKRQDRAGLTAPPCIVDLNRAPSVLLI